ncbi:K(+)/H(+) antiporter 1 [Venturia inaequalis]|nr:K(+)/H(+) antiporter 1 [Venturia inaequalis]
MVILESTMYKYYQRRIRDYSNLGWNRTMYHGLG